MLLTAFHTSCLKSHDHDDKAVDDTHRMDSISVPPTADTSGWRPSVTRPMIVALFADGSSRTGDTIALGTSIVGKGIALIILLQSCALSDVDRVLAAVLAIISSG